MKIQVSLLVTAVAILKGIDTTKMKLSTSYKVRKILMTAQEAVSEFETRRVKLAEKLGTLNEDKTQYLFDDDKKKEAFQKEMTKMMEDEIDIDITPIPIRLIDPYIDIEPHNVQFVEWFVSGLK